MKVREHVWVNDKCIVCGALSWAKVRANAVFKRMVDPGPTDERQCLEREDHQHDIRPEPARREIACESADAIKKRIDELAAERIEAMRG